MPVIPQDTRRIPIESQGPAEIRNPEWMGVGGTAIAQTGAQIANVGEKLNEFNITLDRIKLTNDYIAARNEIKDSTIKMKMAFQDRTDYQKLPGELAQKQAQEKEDFAERWGKDSRLWAKVGSMLGLEHDRQKLEVNHYSRKMAGAEEKAKWKNNTLVVFPKWIADASTPEEAAGYIKNYEVYNQSMLENKLITSGEAEEGARTLKSKSSLLSLNKDIEISPDMAEERLIGQRDKFYPNLTPEDEYKGGLNIEKKRNQLDREEAAAEREVQRALKATYNTTAEEAFNRFKLWDEGKRGPDGKPFYDWLEETDAKGLISQPTYEKYINKIDQGIERESRQAEIAAQKMTPQKWIQFGKIKEQFLDPSKNMGYEDLARLEGRLPDSRIGELSNILASRPSKERAKLLSVEDSFINKSLKDSEATPETWDRIKSQWAVQSKDMADKDLHKLAQDMIKDLPPSSMQQMIDAAKAKRESKSGTGFFGNLFGGSKTTQQKENAPNDPLGIRK